VSLRQGWEDESRNWAAFARTPGHDHAHENINTGFEPCPLPPSQANYPKQTRTVMLPLPRLASMPQPCAGVPRNAFCS